MKDEHRWTSCAVSYTSVSLLGVLSLANFHQTRILLVDIFCTTKEPFLSQAFSFSSSTRLNCAGTAQK